MQLTTAFPQHDVRAIATCPEDTKEVLSRELTALGAAELVPGFRSIAFSAQPDVFYRAHLQLRTASRILRVVGEVPAHSRDALRLGAARLPWHQLLRAEHGFMVDGVPGGRGDHGLRPVDIAVVVREAIAARFAEEGLPAPRVDLEAPRAIVVAFVRDGVCQLSLDTCGRALHKRGYRALGHPAPLKETLAAAVLLYAGYDGREPLCDPMCGSGTLAVEGAMIAYDKAPQIHRKKGQFLLEWQKDFDHALWRQVQDEARARRRLGGEALIFRGQLVSSGPSRSQLPINTSDVCEPNWPREGPETPNSSMDPDPLIFASDIEPRYVQLARAHALAARVERHISFDVGPFENLQPPAPTGLLVCNLPYGERLQEGNPTSPAFFERLGAVLKRYWSGWRAALLVADAAPHRAIGLRPTRRVPLMNGSIPCKLLVFELYAGSRREPGVHFKDKA